MEYINYYKSPLGDIILIANKNELTGLYFTNSKYLPPYESYSEKYLPVFENVKSWLDIYFSGKKPDFTPNIHPIGTEFQKDIWQILMNIPYGETTTYKAIAKIIAKKRGLTVMSAQATGSAVGHNKIQIIIPCHRVIGSNGSLTGYTAGTDKKAALLELEKTYTNN